MSERPTRSAKRQRPSSTEEEETSEGSEGWNPEPLNNDGPPNHKRPRRAAAQATVMSRSSRSTTNSRGDPSLNITVKASSSKLRHATSAATNRRPPTRGTRTRKPMVEVDTDEDLEEEEEEEDAEGEEDVEMADADGDPDMDAEGEEDEDTPPIHAVSRARAAVRGGRRQNPSVKVTPADEVEEKEVRQNIHDPNEEDDEELSDVDDEEDAEGEEDIDAEGEEEEVVRVGAEEDDDDSDLDSDDDETPASGSRALTPDLSKLTRRQRAAYQDLDGGLIALSNEAQKKKHFTAEETAMRRAEMARRRKNLSEKRNEEEKMDTINRLLKKQAPKRNRRAGAEIIPEAGEEESSFQKPSALFARTVETTAGTRVAVPEEWLGKPVGRVFDGPVPAPKTKGPAAGPRKMVEEVS